MLRKSSGDHAPPVELGPLDERIVQRVARRQQHHVVLARRPVAEVHGGCRRTGRCRGAPEGRPARGGCRIERVDDRVRLVDLVVGLREPEPHRVAGERPQHPGVDELLDPRGQGLALVEGVGRASEQIPRDEVVPTAHAHVDGCRVVDGVDRDVAARVARPDDEHALARELRRALVRARVQQLSGELPAERGDVRLGERAVGEDHPVVARLDRAVGRVGAQHPSAVVGFVHRGDPGLEAVRVGQSEALGEVTEILAAACGGPGSRPWSPSGTR